MIDAFKPAIKPEVDTTAFQALRRRNAILAGMSRPIADENGRPVRRSIFQ